MPRIRHREGLHRDLRDGAQAQAAPWRTPITFLLVLLVVPGWLPESDLVPESTGYKHHPEIALDDPRVLGAGSREGGVVEA